MARYLTLLTLALVTATQAAQAFPPYIDNTSTPLTSHAKIRNSIAIDVMTDFSLVRSYLQILEVAAEEDLAVADAIEPMLELNLDDDAALELMLVLIAMEERRVRGEAFDPGDTWMLNLLAIEADKSAAWIDRSIPPHRKRR